MCSLHGKKRETERDYSQKIMEKVNKIKKEDASYRKQKELTNEAKTHKQFIQNQNQQCI